MAPHDPIVDPDGPFTVLQTTNAKPLPLPTYDDITNVAVQVNEAQDLTGASADLGNPGHVTVGAYSFRSPISKFSIEAFDDLEASVGALELFTRYASDRMARGIGKALIQGSGAIKGLITALELANCPAVVTLGSSNNDGLGSSSPQSSIGSQDLSNLFYAVNAAWREQESTRFLMNDSTLTFLGQLLDKHGRPIVSYFSGDDGSRVPVILNREVVVSPSMPNIGAGNVPILFGDMSQWVTRLVSDELTRVRVLKETYILQGQYGLQMFVRADGALAFTGVGSHGPIAMLQQHS
jgi:HK97 family phage major capsid protein